MTALTIENVHSLMSSCLFAEHELVDGKPIIDPVLVEGVMLRIGFHPERLAAAADQIRALLGELSPEFQPIEREGGAGGHSFLALCEDKHGNHWGEHRDCDALLCLGMGIGAARFLMPRPVWSMLPGSMPYILIEI